MFHPECVQGHRDKGTDDFCHMQAAGDGVHSGSSSTPVHSSLGNLAVRVSSWSGVHGAVWKLDPHGLSLWGPWAFVLVKFCPHPNQKSSGLLKRWHADPPCLSLDLPYNDVNACELY